MSSPVDCVKDGDYREEQKGGKTAAFWIGEIAAGGFLDNNGVSGVELECHAI